LPQLRRLGSQRLPLSATLRRMGAVKVSASIPAQLPSNRRWGAAEPGGNRATRQLQRQASRDLLSLGQA